jgi:hypothetical protein
MDRVAGTPAEKLAWLRAQITAGKLDADDPDEVAQAEALLLMLVRLSAASDRKARQHLDELLDGGLRDPGERSGNGGTLHRDRAAEPALR